MLCRPPAPTQCPNRINTFLQHDPAKLLLRSAHHLSQTFTGSSFQGTSVTLWTPQESELPPWDLFASAPPSTTTGMRRTSLDLLAMPFSHKCLADPPGNLEIAYQGFSCIATAGIQKGASSLLFANYIANTDKVSLR